MGLFEHWPYTNFHDLNLDWIISKIKEFGADLKQLADEIDAFQPEMQEYVNNWLNEHPEATTTVEDGSLTESKFSTALRLLTLKDYVTPEMFGAVGDGITDDSDALIDMFESINTGGCAVIPDKTYAISKPVNVYSNTDIVGLGKASIKVLRTGSDFMRISLSLGEYGVSEFTGYDGVHDVNIFNIIFDCGDDGRFASTGHGGGNIGLSHCRNILLSGCYFKNQINDHYIDVAGSKDVLIENCIFDEIRNTGIDAYEAVNIDWSSAEGFPHFGTADNTACFKVDIRGCQFYNQINNALPIGSHYYPAGAAHHQNISITNCLFNKCSYAVKMIHCDKFSFTNNKVDDCGYFSASQAGNIDMFALLLENVNDIVINNNIFSDLINGGVKVQNGGGSDVTYVRHCEIKNNIFENICSNPATAGNIGLRLRYIENVSVFGNIIQNGNNLTANVSYAKNLDFCNNINIASINYHLRFENIENGNVLWNRSNSSLAYDFSGTNSNVIKQLNAETTITAV